MIKNFTRALILIILLNLVQGTQAQSIITQWNFNSVPADASTTTGTITASTGMGILANIGGNTATFASGSSNGGSSDPAATDNSGWGLTGWPAQGTNDKTAGIHFSTSTVGFQNIIVSFDLRHSNTGPRHLQFQYTSDNSVASPVWVDFRVNAATGGDSWFPRSYDLSGVTTLNNNPNAGFRVLATFEPGTSGYLSSNPASSYATTGTWRFDMLSVKGTSLVVNAIPPVASQMITLNHIASFSNGVAGTNSAEIVAHDPASKRLFIANSIGAKIDIVNFANPAAASLVSSIPVSAYGNINSIAVKNGIVAAAIENSIPELPGKVVFFDVNGTFISQVNAGAMPDMITFTNDGTKVLTANEGQPKADYTNDPEGSVTIVDISGGAAAVTQANVTTAGFSAFNAQAAGLKAAGVRIFGLNSPTVAQDMEPEYITISDDGLTAWVTCQENNAIAEINIASSTVTAVRPLGTKNHGAPNNGLDASDQGGVVNIANWPVKGVYMPDAIASYSVAGQTYLVTANEGDAREYTAYSEIVRMSASTYVLDPTIFPNSAALKTSIGRLNVTTASGDTDGDGDFDEIHTFGARSISIWNATTGALVWDSGQEMELITSTHPVYGAIFNVSNANNTLKNRSDDKGPEPEGVAIAQILGRTFAFVALERIGGCMVYDITNPASPVFVDYKNTRNLAAYGGDNGAEGIIYISAANSPTGIPLVILANEVSSTLTFYAINDAVLDITIKSIKAINSGNRNRLEWTTSFEAAGDVFEIEKSYNGTAFTHLTTVSSIGRSSVYSHWDDQPYQGLTYYRLKLKHTSGKISYSPVVTATFKTADTFVQVYPTPAKNQVTIRTNGQQWTNMLVDIVDLAGVVVRKVRMTSQQTTIDISALPAGMYLVRYVDNEGMKTVRIVKQ